MKGKEYIVDSEVRKLYPYQVEAIQRIFDEINSSETTENILFQLPTGGGKTIIFSEIAKRFIKESGKNVLILTHRVELSMQTSNALSDINVSNKIINRDVKELENAEQFDCYVAMVETLNNRLNDDENYLRDIGLVIIDEAHYNSFRKLFGYFNNAFMLGVTATPLSSNRSLPLNDNYNTLIVGDSISDLISKGYLSNATTYTFNVNLRALKVGPDGDYTVSSLDRIYGMYSMQDRLLSAYEERALGKKTLIFNSGIATSIKVYELFRNAGYKVKHLDSTFSPKDRQATLDWFRNTPDAILTSVGILTTGFDEPSIEAIIINRATRSLTLYHQMIGRGSRITAEKISFIIIDLGNNIQRLGAWQDYINWRDIFNSPQGYFDKISEREEELLFDYHYERPLSLKGRFKNPNPHGEFKMKEVYRAVLDAGDKPKKAIDLSIDDHALQIFNNTTDYYEALELGELLNDEIEYRCRLYCNCLSSATESYFNWLVETYIRKLQHKIRQELM